jgi:hypothetical protein
MLDAGGGGGSAGTNWNGYDVEQMWRLVSNQETDNHWRQVSGWDKINELTGTHLSRLREYRDSLAAAWSPEKSPAAKAFVERLDYLIQHVQSVNEVASKNYSTFSTATSTLSTSRYQLKKIYDEYVQKKQQKQAYEEELAFNQSSLLPGVAPSAPKVTQADLDKLNYQARSIMFDLSSTLTQAQVQIKQPPPYKPPFTPVDDGGSSGPGSTYSGGGAPTIPPVVPIPSSPDPGPRSGSPAPVAPVPTPTSPGMGPILGGAGPVAPPAPPTSPTVINPPAVPSYPTGPYPPGTPFPSMPGMPMTGGPLPPSGSPGMLKPGIGGYAGLPKAMPPGGLIGGTPGAGLGQPATGTTPRRINPVGGVIGGNNAGTGATGRGGMPGAGATGRGASATGRLAAGQGQSYGTASGNRSAAPDEAEAGGPRWDPDNPWETSEGVAPVVLPSNETGRVDPGPAIGFHR